MVFEPFSIPLIECSSPTKKNKDAYQNYLKVVDKSEISHTLAPTIGLIIQHLSVKEKPEFEKLRASFIDYFVKITVSSKTIPPRHVIVCHLSRSSLMDQQSSFLLVFLTAELLQTQLHAHGR